MTRATLEHLLARYGEVPAAKGAPSLIYCVEDQEFWMLDEPPQSLREKKPPAYMYRLITKNGRDV